MRKGTTQYACVTYSCTVAHVSIVSNANAVLAQDLCRKQKVIAAPCLPLETLVNGTAADSKRAHPEQGLICSQVISRKGSYLPSEAEYLRAVSQRLVQKIVKSDQHQHRKDARRQW